MLLDFLSTHSIILDWLVRYIHLLSRVLHVQVWAVDSQVSWIKFHTIVKEKKNILVGAYTNSSRVRVDLQCLRLPSKESWNNEFSIDQHSWCSVVGRQTFDRNSRPMTEGHESYIVHEYNRRNTKTFNMMEQKIQNLLSWIFTNLPFLRITESLLTIQWVQTIVHEFVLIAYR